MKIRLFRAALLVGAFACGICTLPVPSQSHTPVSKHTECDPVGPQAPKQGHHAPGHRSDCD